MILVDGEKYACVQCIRGHRSSTCKHSSRPLLQVRSRGRPAITAGHRIAVTESEIVMSRDEVNIQKPESNPKSSSKIKSSAGNSTKLITPTLKKSCCSAPKTSEKLPERRNCCSNPRESCSCSNKNGVILLKASKRQFVDVQDGNLDFVGPYNVSSVNNFKVERLRNKKLRAVGSHVDQLQLVKTFKVNKIDYDFAHNGLNNSQEPMTYSGSTSSSSSILSSNQSLTIEKDLLNSSVYIDKVFQNLQNAPLDQDSGEYVNQSNSPGYAQLSNSKSDYLEQKPPSEHNLLFDMMLSTGCADICNCGKDCSCPGCLIHRTNDELKEYGILQDSSSTTVSTPTEIRTENDEGTINFTLRDGILIDQSSQAHPNFSNITTEPQLSQELNPMDLVNFQTVDEILLQQIFEDNCICESNECKCYNCTEHGISEGIRLIDGVKVAQTPGILEIPTGLNHELLEEEAHDCDCLPEECECYNCFEHGIVNGVRVTQNSNFCGSVGT